MFQHLTTRSRRLSGVVLLSLAGLTTPLFAQSVVSKGFDGVWGGVLELPPTVSGHIEVQHAGGRWTLRIPNSAPVNAAATYDTVRLILPNNRGELRLEQIAKAGNSAAPRAFWIQPPGMGSSYATPVLLTRTGTGRWRGILRPLPNSFSLYLAMRPGAGDTVWGTFRNPESNFGGGRRLRVAAEPNRLVLFDSSSGRQRFAQSWNATERTIGFDFGAPLTLREVSLRTTRGLVPRLPTEPTTYQTPRVRQDGWPVRSAVAAGANRAALDALVREWSSYDLHGGKQPRVHAVLAVQNGTLLMEEYFRDWNADRLHDLRSASKTLTGILFGTLMQQQPKHTVSDTVLPSGVTVAHLLTHTSGLDCNDEDSKSTGNEDRMQEQQEQPDWYAYARALSQRYAPGTHYAYCSAGINLAGEHIMRSSGQWLPAYFDRSLAAPLGITHYAWNLMPTGQGYAGGGVRLRARDLLKFGQLWLNDGVWQGKRLVPSHYVAASVQRQQPDTAGADDGYTWHRNTLRVNGRTLETYEAGGNGGQLLVVVPAIRVVVVVFAEHYGEGPRWLRLRNEVVVPVLEALRL
ncbi:MAG: beta-lactamase family protein [Gemmatimonadaceae bacterium]|nr:beta-lactamase family protein [Gemmatimonadaceae bacterium]